jgi:hypothetical protein
MWDDGTMNKEPVLDIYAAEQVSLVRDHLEHAVQRRWVAAYIGPCNLRAVCTLQLYVSTAHLPLQGFMAIFILCVCF